MMIFQRTALLLTAAAGLTAFACWGQSTNQPQGQPEIARAEADLPHPKISQLGDPVPALAVQEWIKGKPVKIHPGTNFYAIVFCTLSHANQLALTNLSGLQRLYGDRGLITVVISDESPETLRDFVTRRGGDIDFTVAADDFGRKTTTDYQRTFDDTMLPRAFVVGKDGNLLWHGHPLRDDMGEVVDKIATGRYDLKAAKKDVRDLEMMEAYLRMAREDDPRAAKAGGIMLIVRTNDAPALCDLAFQIAADPYIGKRDLALANEALDRAEQLSTTNAADIAVYRSILIFQAGKHEDGLAHAKQALAIAKTDAEKSEVDNCIKLMEARVAADKTNRPAGPSDTAGQPKQ
jgi:hypothetical protein